MKVPQAPFIVIMLFPVVTPDGGVYTGNGFRAGVEAMSPDDVSDLDRKTKNSRNKVGKFRAV
jgi:hypothetical protein